MVGVELRSQNLDDIEVTEVVSRRSSIGSMTVASEQQVPSQLKSLELKMYSQRLTDGINYLLGTNLSLRKSTACLITYRLESSMPCTSGAPARIIAGTGASAVVSPLAAASPNPSSLSSTAASLLIYLIFSSRSLLP